MHTTQQKGQFAKFNNVYMTMMVCFFLYNYGIPKYGELIQDLGTYIANLIQ